MEETNSTDARNQLLRKSIIAADGYYPRVFVPDTRVSGYFW